VSGNQSKRGKVNLKMRFVYGAMGALCLMSGSLYAQSGRTNNSLNLSKAVPTSGLQEPSLSYAAAAPNYQISPDDVLDIRVFREPDLSTTVRVGNDGSIMFPLIGRVQVGGLAVEQVSKIIRSKLAGGYLPNPQVSVNVTEFNHRRFTVLGQVSRSGTYDFPDVRPLDLLQAIGVAGGYTNIADPANVTIKRTVNGQVNVYRVNAKKLARGEAKYDVQVQPGDIIIVAESLF
jgi:protein involved in polysaccharide export with SLBB domain